MTFEEFFTKKRIDLEQLKKADPQLLSEFRQHFELMGEKSFDHSKKFWFNRLRHLYHLETPAKATITQVETSIASQAEPLSSSTIEQSPVADKPSDAPASAENKPAYKPRFKPRSVPAVKDDAQQASPATAVNPQNAPASQEGNEQASPEVKSEEASKAPAPPVKRPPFKPRNVKPVSGEPSEDAQKTESRPGQTQVSDTPVINKSEAEEVVKPAYKPKFNIRNISRSPAGAAEQTGSTVEKQEAPTQEVPEQKVPQPEIPKDQNPASPEEPGKPAAYKPRFKMRNMAPPAAKEEEEKTAEVQPEENVQASPIPSGSETREEEAKPKPAYKPRFNIKNIKPKSPEGE